MAALRLHHDQPRDDERRRHPRVEVHRPAKLFCGITGRYLGARTCNVSEGGVLLEVNHPSLLVAGQQVRVGIAWNNGALLNADDMSAATVVRSLGLGEAQTVAVKFSRKQQLQATA